jgi:hypothetical protein
MDNQTQVFYILIIISVFISAGCSCMTIYTAWGRNHLLIKSILTMQVGDLIWCSVSSFLLT